MKLQIIFWGSGIVTMRKDDNASEVPISSAEKVVVSLAEYDPAWPNRFEQHAKRVRDAVGEIALQVEHIGSTSVPGLAAKPIIDILLVVPKSANEDSYLPALLTAGYQLRVREPDFHEHRMLGTPRRDVHVHILSRDCPETERYLVFRDRLRRDPNDRARYEKTKRTLAEQSWADMDAYADAKTNVIESIIASGMQERSRGS